MGIPVGFSYAENPVKFQRKYEKTLFKRTIICYNNR